MEHRGVDSNWLAVLVSVVALTILGITLLVSLFDARLQARTVLLASSLAQANQELAQLALHDTLTRLPNRVLLEIVWNRPSAKRIGKARLSRYCLWIWMALKPLMTLMVMILAISYWWRSRIV